MQVRRQLYCKWLRTMLVAMGFILRDKLLPSVYATNVKPEACNQKQSLFKSGIHNGDPEAPQCDPLNMAFELLNEKASLRQNISFW